MDSWLSLGSVLGIPEPPPVPIKYCFQGVGAGHPGLEPAFDHAPGRIRVKGEIKALIFSLFTLGVAWIVLEFTTLGPTVPVTVPLLMALIVALGQILYRQSSLKDEAVRDSENQMPEIWRKIQEAGKNLDFAPLESFVIHNNDLNAYAMGLLGKDAIVLHSGTVRDMGYKELQFIIGPSSVT